jgi:hypothetical protein
MKKQTFGKIFSLSVACLLMLAINYATAQTNITVNNYNFANGLTDWTIVGNPSADGTFGGVSSEAPPAGCQ